VTGHGRDVVSIRAPVPRYRPGAEPPRPGPYWQTGLMGIRGLNMAQRVVIVVALGVGLVLFGRWIVGYWQGDTFGWVAYAPLSGATNAPRALLHPWVRLVIWLALTVVWAAGSLAVLSTRRVSRRDDQAVASGAPSGVRPPPAPTEREERG
jgi:hypothetical protein